jgi:CheY-like chemotaxis protein
MLSVCDDGCGMDRATRERIFEPFFTTKGPGESTGLGLSMVYGVVQQNGGCIEVASTPGKGTTFTLSFPLASGEVMLVDTDELAEHSASGKTILLVEDDSSVLKMVEHMLCELGYEVLAVDSPKEAIRLARSFAGGIDLLVTDMVMPKMSGPELIDALHEDLPGLKVLFISGYIHQIKEVWNNDILGIGFLQKPFTLNDLSVNVRYILHQHDEKK